MSIVSLCAVDYRSLLTMTLFQDHEGIVVLEVRLAVSVGSVGSSLVVVGNSEQ